MQYVRLHLLDYEKDGHPSEHRDQVENDVHTGRPGLSKRPGPYLKHSSAKSGRKPTTLTGTGLRISSRKTKLKRINASNTTAVMIEEQEVEDVTYLTTRGRE